MIRRLALAAVLCLATLLPLLPSPAQAQQSSMPPVAGSFTEAQRREIVEVIRQALRSDPTILRDAIMALQADESSRQEGAARAAIVANAEALLRAAGDPIDGNPNGDVTVVEFYDVRCPYCRRMLPVMADLLKRERNVRVVYKDIPILGPGSVVAAKAVLAAQRQGAYLKLREALMTGTAQIDTEVVKAAARRLNLDWDRLQRDMADPAIQARIDANLRLAHVLDIQGTPAYVIGEQMLPGAISLADLQGTITQARRR